MSNEKTGWNLRPENPYSWASPVPVMRDPREKPTLSVVDIDRLVALKLADERQEAAERQRLACAGAWEEGREHGTTTGRRLASEGIDKVIVGHLNPIVRRLDDRVTRSKTTIADERHFVEQQARALERAISALALRVDTGA